MSWFERALGHRRYFDQMRTAYGREGTRLAHRWMQLVCGATTEWAVRVFRDLDDTMARDHHDGASGWGAFRDDVTGWLAAHVSDHATPADRSHLAIAAGCCTRHLGAVGHAGAAVCARWQAALDHGDATELDRVIAAAATGDELARGVRALIAASARVIDGATAVVSTGAPSAPPARSGEPLTAGGALSVRIWPRTGGELVLRFERATRLTIGRAPGADVELVEDLVARHHAELVETEGGVAVVDLRSDNGTCLWGARVERPTLLQHGDALFVGQTVVFVEHG